MKRSEIIRKGVMTTLQDNNMWMTANEIISYADYEEMNEMAKHDSSRRANSHPVFRVLTSMVREDEHHIYTPEVQRRVRLMGSEIGCYEYSLKGVNNSIKRMMTAIKNA